MRKVPQRLLPLATHLGAARSSEALPYSSSASGLIPLLDGLDS